MRLRMGNSSGLLIAVGIVLAVAAAGIVWFLGYRSNQKVRVVVARQNVPSLTDLVATDVEMRSVPIQAVPRDALRSPAAALGRFVRYGLLRGQVVQAANLAATAAGASQFDEQLTAAAKHRPGVRAVTLSVTPQAGLVLPTAGDHVDLMAVVSAGKSVPKQARVLVRHALVLDRLVTGGAPASTGGKAVRQNAAQVQAGLLVLALTVHQAQEVALAESGGTVQVVLDPLGSRGRVHAKPLTETAAWTVKPSAAAVKPAKGGK